MAKARASKRPRFIVSSEDVSPYVHRYPRSKEGMAARRAIGRAAGLEQIGLHLITLRPGERTSWPHCEEKEEEFAFVVDGQVDCWIDGTLHAMRAGDLVAWPSGTGISHALLNNGKRNAVVLGGGQTEIRGSRIFYPLHLGRQDDMTPAQWWHDVPRKRLGPHDGLPDRQRAAGAVATTAPRGRTRRK